MKIGLLSWILDRQRTGIDNYLYNIVEEMIKCGKAEDISLIHYKKSDDKIYTKINDIIVKTLPLKYNMPYGLPKAIENAGIDVFHLPSHWPTQITPFFPNLNVKKVLTIHDIIPILFKKNLPHIYKLWKPTLKLITNKIDFIITDSENTKHDCIKFLKIPEDKIRVIYLAADKKYKPLHNKNVLKDEIKCKYNIDCPFILYVGNVESRKNIILLIKSLYKLKNKGITHKLVLIGALNFGSKQIFDLVQELGLIDEVIFPGYVSNEDLVKFYNIADLFVYPSLYEGFGLPPLEAMSCGCPVITSNSSSLPEVVGDAGLMVDPYDHDDLTNKMYQILTNEGLRFELSNKSLNRAKMFNWEKTARETWQVYEEVFDGRK
jgi:glycosyltransferase involved in cell wall biosynthesis